MADYQITPRRHSIIYLVSAVALALLLVFLIWLVFFHTNKPSSTATSPSSTTKSVAQRNTSPKSSESAQNGQSNNTDASSDQHDSTSGTSDGSSSSLANTGPGNVLIVFMSAAIIGSSVHYFVSRRRTHAL